MHAKRALGLRPLGPVTFERLDCPQDRPRSPRSGVNEVTFCDGRLSFWWTGAYVSLAARGSHCSSIACAFRIARISGGPSSGMVPSSRVTRALTAGVAKDVPKVEV